MARVMRNTLAQLNSPSATRGAQATPQAQLARTGGGIDPNAENFRPLAHGAKTVLQFHLSEARNGINPKR